MGDEFESSTLDEAYFDRNQAVMLAALLAHRCGYHVWASDEHDPEWPVLFIELPTGQVSWHIPKDALAGTYAWVYGKWDGHDLATKRQRLHEMIETHPT